MKSRIVQPAASFQPPETCTEHEECQAAQASHSELCDKALAHYEEVSTAAHHWNSLVPRAIEFYKLHGDRASLAAVEGDAQAKAKAIVEEYKQRVVQLPSGDVVPCAKWLETRLRIAFDLAAASSPAPAEPPKFVSEVDQWKHDLTTAGWIAETALNWRAPDGSLWRGPAGAWQELQRRLAAQTVNDSFLSTPINIYPVRCECGDLFTEHQTSVGAAPWDTSIYPCLKCSCKKFTTVPAEPLQPTGEQDAITIFREGLDRIWRLLDLAMEHSDSDRGTLQRVAHDHLARGNTAMMAQARNLAIAISGDSDSANEITTPEQAQQIIKGVLRERLESKCQAG